MNTAEDATAGIGQAAKADADPASRLVRSVDRALRLLDFVAEGSPEGLTLTELSKALGMSKSSVLATARTLVAHGYLHWTEVGAHYKLGMALIRLGDLTTRQLPLGDICGPILRELSETTGTTSRLAIADHGHPLFIARNDGPGTVRFHTTLGLRELPHCTAAGKAILSTMPEDEVRAICEATGLPARTRHTITEPDTLLEELELVRRRGFAMDDEEDAEGVFCIGAAFFGHDDTCAGAISVTAIKVDLPTRRVEALGSTLRRYADRVSSLLGGRPYSQLSMAPVPLAGPSLGEASTDL